MNITVTAERPENDKVVATLTIPAADVNKAINQAYKTIAQRYAFQGFRRGRAPRPVIDGIVGHQAVLADATNDLLNEASPLMINELDIVPVERPDFNEDLELVTEGEDYTVTATIQVPPTVELSSYDAPAIIMPPAEVTDAEVEQQLEQLMSYQVRYEDLEEDRAAEASDIVSVDIENVDGAEDLAGKNRMLSLSGAALPEELIEGIVGMKKGETNNISWSHLHESGERSYEHKFEVNVTLNAIKETITPELTDEIAQTMGYDTVEELREAVKEEVAEDKERSLPALKEDRVVEAMGKLVTLEELPEAYENQVFSELANEFLGKLQRQGMSLDMYLGARQIETEDFLADLHVQAAERARQSLALDALAAKLELDATEEDVIAEFQRARVDNVKTAMAEFVADGRMPAIRESIRRSKAVKWLVDNAEVTEVDEIAERRAKANEADEADEGNQE